MKAKIRKVSKYKPLEIDVIDLDPDFMEALNKMPFIHNKPTKER